MEHVLITVVELAEALRIRPGTVRVWIRQGRVRTLGGRGWRRIPSTEIERLLRPQIPRGRDPQ